MKNFKKLQKCEKWIENHQICLKNVKNVEKPIKNHENF